MKWTSALAIYALFWVMCAFIVLPFHARTHDEAGVAKIPGQADSAPAEFRAGLIAARTTIVSALLFGLYYLNYVNGWVGAEAINFFSRPG